MAKHGNKGGKGKGGGSKTPQQQSNVGDGTCSNGGSLQAPMTPQPAVEFPQEQPVENIAAGAQAVSPVQAQAGNAPAEDAFEEPITEISFGDQQGDDGTDNSSCLEYIGANTHEQPFVAAAPQANSSMFPPNVSSYSNHFKSLLRMGNLLPIVLSSMWSFLCLVGFSIQHPHAIRWIYHLQVFDSRSRITVSQPSQAYEALLAKLKGVSEIPQDIFSHLTISQTALRPADITSIAKIFDDYIRLHIGPITPAFTFAMLLKLSPAAVMHSAHGETNILTMFSPPDLLEDEPVDSSRLLGSNLPIPALPTPANVLWYRHLKGIPKDVFDAARAAHLNSFDYGTRFIDRETQNSCCIFSQLQRIMFLFMMALANHLNQKGFHWAAHLTYQLKSLLREHETSRLVDYGIFPNMSACIMKQFQLDYSFGAMAFLLFIDKYPQTITTQDYGAISAVYAYSIRHSPLGPPGSGSAIDYFNQYEELVKTARSATHDPSNPQLHHPSSVTASLRMFSWLFLKRL